MQTFNSFNALAVAQHEAPLQSQMSVFNAGAMSDSVGRWFKQAHADECHADQVADITFAELLNVLKSGKNFGSSDKCVPCSV